MRKLKFPNILQPFTPQTLAPAISKTYNKYAPEVKA
jgi:hypothetical protein